MNEPWPLTPPCPPRGRARTLRSVSGCLLCLTIGCSTATQPADHAERAEAPAAGVAADPTPHPPVSTAESPADSASELPTATDDRATESTAAGEATGDQVPSRRPAAPPPSFTPPEFAPPYPTTAAAGDGTWMPMGDASAGEPAAEEPHVVFRSTVHPHDKNRFVSLDLVAIDLRRVDVHWIIGKKDEGAARLQPFMTPGLIPDAHQADVLAVFNGGFQARHGWWGMMSDGVTVLAAKDSGCTVALTTEGVHIAPWAELGVPPDQLLAFRQTPPCLARDGRLHERLTSGSTRIWAGQNPDRKTRRRSAIGIDAERRVLYFAIGTEAGPLELARGMVAAGATDAAQLDINWAWTRFLLAGRRDGKPRITSSLVADPLHGKNEYFSRPSDRDFFYLKRRTASELELRGAGHSGGDSRPTTIQRRSTRRSR